MDLDLLTQYEIPTAHPLVMHVALTLLALAAGAALVYAVRGTALWRQSALVFLVLGAGAAFAAGQTGTAYVEASQAEPIVMAVAETHDTAAMWMRWGAVAALVAFAAASLWLRRLPAPTEVGKRDPALLRAALVLVALVPAAAAALAAHLAAVMVWGRPVG